MRAPDNKIPAPPFPRELAWANVAMLRMDQQKGRPVLVEFWDFCRVNSLRTIPYLQAWHERYAEEGLRVIGVHSGAFPPSQDEEQIRAAVERLGITYPVAIDGKWNIWHDYGNKGWPARYLWTQDLWLHSQHYGEGAYGETEREIQELLGIERELVEPRRPEDAADALVGQVTAEQTGAYNGLYEAGSVWAVVSGSGTLTVNGVALEVEYPGCVPLVEHERHTAGVLELQAGDGVTVHAVQFAPGVVA
ncbi:MAG: redoxin domain-containing protein [Solirubrobacteraceae bacterium]|nr:redoxin domain-containing protein [Solirubrobacteraceae bacterium]